MLINTFIQWSHPHANEAYSNATHMLQWIKVFEQAQDWFDAEPTLIAKRDLWAKAPTHSIATTSMQLFHL